MAVVSQVPGHLPDTEDGCFQELLVDPPHQVKVLIGLALGVQWKKERAIDSSLHCCPMDSSGWSGSIIPRLTSRPGLQLSFQKRVGHRQLPNLGLELLHLLLVALGLLAASAFELTHYPQ
ncbi:hypothetical protein [Nitratireductor alexandrii]|uniref:hypothetical protein n=1 Tax=Nitratireductor alexandrii TaxID=2448161 RepID=UPI001EE99885|nr:hypothetical protein [Nitratireductor alexandrii]